MAETGLVTLTGPTEVTEMVLYVPQVPELLEALTTAKKKLPQEPGTLENVWVVLFKIATTVAEPITDPTVYVALLRGKSAETKSEFGLRKTRYPPGSGLAWVKDPFTVPLVLVADKPVTLAVGVILVLRLV